MRIRAGLGFGTSAAAALALVAAAAATPASATMAAGGEHGGIRTLAPAVTTSASRPVILPTGDRVILGRNATGAPTLTVTGRMSGGAATSLRVGGATYVVPQSVRALVGSTLDLALFDATAIAARGGRTPVTVTYAAASSPTAVPGVEITSRDGLRGTGVITAASSRALGAALAAHPASALFAGVSSLRAASSPARTTDARWPMHTLTIKAIDRDGRPYAGLVGYMSTSDAGKPNGVAVTNYRGIAKISVPAGIYTLLGAGFAPDGSDGFITLSPEFTVSGAREASIDLRTATTPTTATMPWAVDPTTDTAVTTLDRTVTTGEESSGWSMMMIGSRATRIYLSPTVGTLHGTQSVSRYDYGSSPAGAPAPYRVDVMQAVDGRIPTTPIRFRHTSGNTRTIRTTFHGPSDLSTSMFGTTISTARGGGGVGTSLAARRLTHYVSASPGTYVDSELTQDMNWDTYTASGWFRSFAKLGTAGTTTTESWGRAALHSRFLTPDLNDMFPMACSTCIKDGVVGLISLPMSDAAGHIGNPDMNADGTIKGSYAVLADGREIASGVGFLNAGASYPAGTKVITGRQSATRGGGIFPVTTSLTTEFSTPVKAALPLQDGLGCPLGDEAGCTMLPMLSAQYSAAVDLDNRLPAGKQAIDIDLAQAGRTSPVGITGVKAWVSYDGSTWVSAPVTGSGGHYAATVTIPRASAGRSVAGLKITATDKAGSTLTETIAGAFRLPR
ncbi:MAG: hypothetical protein U0Q21_12645 [Dermatophilaceae bacterium]